ncbi:Unknown protein, partial [Striga hermonthica]
AERPTKAGRGRCRAQRARSTLDTEVVVEAEEWSGVTDGRTGERCASGGDAREPVVSTRSAWGARGCTVGEQAADIGWYAQAASSGRAGRAGEGHAGGNRNLAGVGVRGSGAYAREINGRGDGRATAREWETGASAGLCAEGIGGAGSDARDT